MTATEHLQHRIDAASTAENAETQRPVRIQRQRTKGWRMPANTIYVGRGSKWGNPFVVHSDRMQNRQRYPMTPEVSVASFRSMLTKEGVWFPVALPWPKGKVPACQPTTVEDVRQELRGHNLACWCRLAYPDGSTYPCHADVLLEIANG